MIRLVPLACLLTLVVVGDPGRALGNGPDERCAYVPGDHQVQTLPVPGATGFTYQYDATTAKARESDAPPAGEDPISTTDNSAMYTLSMDQIRKIWLWNDSGLMSDPDESIRKRLSAETMPQELWQRARDKVQYTGSTPTYVPRTDETSRREKQLLEAKVRWMSDQATMARLKRYFSLRLLDARRPVSEWVTSVDPKNPGDGIYSDPRGYVYDPLPTMGHDAMVGQFVWAFSGPLTSLMNTDLTPGWHVGHPFTEDLLRWMIMERLTTACAIVKEWESQGLGVDQPSWPIVIGNARNIPLEFTIDADSGLGLFRVRAQDALYDADPDLFGNIGRYEVLSWEDGRDALGAKMETADGRRHLYLKVRNRDSAQDAWIPVYGRTPEAGLAIRLVMEAEYLSICLSGRDQEAFWNTAWNDSPVWLMAYAVGDFLVGASSIHALVTGYDFRTGEGLTGGQYAVNAGIAALNLIPGVATITRRAVVAVRSGAAADLARSLLSRNLNLAPQAVKDQLANVVESMANGGRHMAASAKQLAVGTKYLLASAEVKGLNVTARQAAEDLATWFLSHCGAARMGDSLLAKTGSQAPVMNPFLVLKDAAKRPVPDAALVRETMQTTVDDAVAASNDLARAQKVMDAKAGTHGATGAAATTEKLMAKGGCFPAGTPVLMADGTYKPIELIAVGDRVASRDEHQATADMMPGLVEKVMVRSKESVIHLQLHRNGDDLLVKPTEEHPFWVHGRGWTVAGHIMVGDVVRGDVGDWTVVSASKVVLGRIIPVYNFTVSDLHTYFVGSISPNGPPKWVWAHNTSKLSDFADRLVKDTVGMTKPVKTPVELADATVEAAERIAKGETDAIVKMAWRSDPGSYYTYTELRAKIRASGLSGRSSGLQAHHLLEKQFAAKLGVAKDDIISVALTPGWHGGVRGIGTNIDALITRELRLMGSSPNTATVEQIWKAHKNVYLRHGNKEWADAIHTAYFQHKGIAY